jgi:hypothetical protein
LFIILVEKKDEELKSILKQLICLEENRIDSSDLVEQNLFKDYCNELTILNKTNFKSKLIINHLFFD